jgi:hypothetical protein
LEERPSPSTSPPHQPLISYNHGNSPSKSSSKNEK